MLFLRASGSRLCLAALVVAFFAAAPPAGASPITDALKGEWSGSGRITRPDGKTERIRCRGTTRSPTENTVEQYFDCASTGKFFDFSSSLHFSGDRVRGTWRSGGRTGTVSGRATRSSINARLSSDTGTGSLQSSIRGCTQTLTITGWSKDLKSLTAQLKKDC
jgi:hypothetical protein